MRYGKFEVLGDGWTEEFTRGEFSTIVATSMMEEVTSAWSVTEGSNVMPAVVARSEGHVAEGRFCVYSTLAWDIPLH